MSSESPRGANAECPAGSGTVVTSPPPDHSQNSTRRAQDNSGHAHLRRGASQGVASWRVGGVRRRRPVLGSCERRGCGRARGRGFGVSPAARHVCQSLVGAFHTGAKGQFRGAGPAAAALRFYGCDIFGHQARRWSGRGMVSSSPRRRRWHALCCATRGAPCCAPRRCSWGATRCMCTQQPQQLVHNPPQQPERFTSSAYPP